jgi:peptidoglycan hydrolase CwlO-like protein
LGLANPEQGEGNERAHAEPGVTLKKLEEELKKLKERIKKLEKIIKEEKREYDFDKWEGTD